MAKAVRLGKCESCPGLGFAFVRIDGWRAGQGIAIVEPTDEVAVLAAGAAERCIFGAAGLAAERAFADVIRS